MPTIAIVDGIKIQMFYNDHAPAHFHAILAGDEVLAAIGSLDVLPGGAPTFQAAPRAGVGARPPGRDGAELDQVPGRAGAGEDLAMPRVSDNVITEAMPDPRTPASPSSGQTERPR
jgi:hypothetical protein